MKVIKQPNIKAWKTKVKCFACTAELEVDADDIVYNGSSGDARDGGFNESSVTCKCCVCENTVYVSMKDVPGYIVLHAQVRKKGRSLGCRGGVD